MLRIIVSLLLATLALPAQAATVGKNPNLAVGEIWNSPRPPWGTHWQWSTATNTAKIITIPSGGTWNWSRTNGNGGILEDLYLGVAGTDTSNNLQIIVDGVTIFNGWDALLVALPPGTSAFQGKYLGWNPTGGTSTNIRWRIPIPYQNSIQLIFTNNTGAPNIAFIDVTGRDNIGPCIYANSCHLHIVTNRYSAAAPYVNMPLASVLNGGPGVIFAVGYRMNGVSASPTTAPYEGTTKIFIDGAPVPTFWYTGMEEVFDATGYFTECQTTVGPLPLYTPMAGGIMGCVDHTATATSTFRFYENDPIYFNKGFIWSVDNGEAYASTFTGTTDFWSVIYYYTRN
jgi:hypothetical protein